ncbi:3,4-dihydroxy-2-butanone-4-phosphate synthase [Nocardia suismassiliense]|uniref:3,4-dihydroxy-2-butanone-4-phosphate synthase n=1 Tax=Nocardia suismassiliense TaxID=2077092 RepID=UPI000D1D8211|nr:3,4-dihydroxy-2-butanone-4-phosphate synthase [Nocardia suismassiliense]
MTTCQADLHAGRPIVVLGGETGGLVLAACHASPATVAFLIRHGAGFLRVALFDETADRLNLPLMWQTDPRAQRFTVSVDAADGISTGISAVDRTRTIRLLADAGTRADDLCRPGHVVPIRVTRAAAPCPGAPGYALALVHSAGLPPAAALTELMQPDGSLADDDALREFAHRYELTVVDPRVTELPERVSR